MKNKKKINKKQNVEILCSKSERTIALTEKRKKDKETS